MKKLKKKYLVVVLLSAVCFFSTIFYFCFCVNSNLNIDSSINENWNIKVHGKTYKDVEIGQFGFKIVNRSDTVELETILPNKHFDTPAFRLYTWNTAFDVYLNDKKIYSYGYEEYYKKKLVGSGVFFIPLPENFQNEKLKIVMTVNEDRAFSTIRPMALGNMNDLCFEIILKNSFAFILTMILLLFGLVCTTVSSIMIFFAKKFKRMFFDLALIGSLSFLSGCWSMCSYNFIYLFTNHSIANVYAEYGSLYLAYLPLLLIIYDNEKYKFNEKVYKFFAIIYTIFLSLTVILQITNIRHIPLMLIPYHILALTTMVCGFFVFLKNKHIYKSDKILRIGYIVSMASVFIHMIMFNVFKFLLKGNYHVISLLYVVGVFVLVASIFTSNVLYWKEHFVSEQDMKSLNKMAYEDVLTGLFNRQKITETLLSLQRKQKIYAILCMDLNNLKTINDTYGHQAGDALLMNFSKCLKEASVKGETITARVGGDEFLVIILNANLERINAYNQRLTKIVDEFNANVYEKFSLSYAYGSAIVTEVEKGDFDLVIKLADSRMYEMKRKMKENLGKKSKTKYKFILNDDLENMI